MKDLLKIEYIKGINNRTVRASLILYLAVFLVVFIVFSQIELAIPGFNIRKLYRFPGVWTSTTWLASWLNILLAIVIISHTGNEFTYRTFKQHIIDGLSRQQLLYGKVFIILALSLASTVLVGFSAVISDLIFGLKQSTEDSFIQYLPKFFLQSFAYMSFALMLTLLLKSPALSIVIFILYRIIIEPIARLTVDLEFRHFFPSKAIGNLTPNIVDLVGTAGANYKDLDLKDADFLLYQSPEVLTTAIVVVYTLIFLGISISLLSRKDF